MNHGEVDSISDKQLGPTSSSCNVIGLQFMSRPIHPFSLLPNPIYSSLIFPQLQFTISKKKNYFFSLFIIQLSLSLPTYWTHIWNGGSSKFLSSSAKCGYTVWPGLLSNAGTAQLSTTGFALNSGDSLPLPVPASWSGRMWGRTLCSQDSITGKFTCLTGDCGSGTIECGGSGAAPPATLAEFTLDGAGGLDFYDVSLVDGYNLPVVIAPQGGGNCTITGCAADLNSGCPAELKVEGGGGGLACRSACEAFGEAKYCCSGEYGTPDTCKASVYSEVLKRACPRAYSYAYDDGSSTFTCASADYTVTFCPTPTSSSISQKSSTTLLVSNGGDTDLRNKPFHFFGFLVAAAAAAAAAAIAV